MTTRDDIAQAIQDADPEPYVAANWEASAYYGEIADRLMPLVRRAQAEAFTGFTDHFEAIANEVERPNDATAEYWQGCTDSTDYFIARLRSHADFLANGHDDD